MNLMDMPGAGLRPMDAPAEREPMIIQLVFNGQRLFDKYNSYMMWNASSGLVDKDQRKVIRTDDGQTIFFYADYRFAYYQNLYDHGPVPEGVYEVAAQLQPGGVEDYAGWSIPNAGTTCVLLPSHYIEKIPRGDTGAWPSGGPTKDTAGSCEKFWANWGYNRVALNPLGRRGTFSRGGFFLHDSSKGFTHGCIETETRFFTWLIDLVKAEPKIMVYLQVIYPDGALTRTYGGTNHQLTNEEAQDRFLDRAISFLKDKGKLPPPMARSDPSKRDYTLLGNPVDDAAP
jgi:hypothetical protein